jgi:hypothetical protein
MRIIVLLAVLAFALPAWAQAPAETAKAAAPKAKLAKAAKRWTAKRFQDARHCLQRPTNDAVIRCAEEYL